MKKIIIFLILGLICVFLLKIDWGLAMGMHHYYVDLNSPDGEVAQGRPPGNSNELRIFKGAFYEATILYPSDYLINHEYWRQVVDLSVRSRPKEEIKFRVLKWLIRDAEGKIFEPKVWRKDGLDGIESILNKEYKENGLITGFSFHYNIPSKVKNIFIEVKIELEGPKGERAVIDETIPLKQARFKTKFFKGFNP